MKQNYFPLGIAVGKAFCNRIKEKERLQKNIETSTSTLISAPRRFGKTSLVIETLQRQKIMFVHIDFFSASSIEDILSCILKGVGEAITLVQPNFKKALDIAIGFFTNIQVKIELGKAGINISPNQKISNPINEIDNALSKLKQLLKKHDKKMVLFFDEFQILGQIPSNINIEAIIRSHVQMPSNITFIFSGSTRHLLNQMFNDRNRPFYNLCDKLIINKISAEDYIVFLNHAAKDKWKKQLPQEIIDEIFNLTSRHPFYVNALCFKVWQNKTVPSLNDIRLYWNYLGEEQKAQIALELELLSLNQKKLLSGIAKLGKNVIGQSKEFIRFTGMASSSIYQTLQTMLKKDFIEETEEGIYIIIDPMLEYLLK